MVLCAKINVPEHGLYLGGSVDMEEAALHELHKIERIFFPDLREYLNFTSMWSLKQSRHDVISEGEKITKHSFFLKQFIYIPLLA